jgi:spore maturation protein CgeB
MKILYVDAMKAMHAQSNVCGLTNSFKKYGEVIPFDYRTLTKISSPESMCKTLLKNTLKIKPNFIFLGKCESVLGWAIEEIKKIYNPFIVSFLGDFYYDLAQWKSDHSRWCDLTLFSYYDKRILKLYKEAGVKNVGFWTDGFDSSVPEVISKRTNDIIFMGHNHFKKNCYLENYKFRYDLLTEVDNKFNLSVYGEGWDNFKNIKNWVTGIDKERETSKAKISIGINAVTDYYLYASWPRVFQTMRSGTMFMTQYVPGCEQLFENKKHLVWFHTKEECFELLNYYLSHDEEREQIGQQGKELVYKNHSYDNRVRGIIDMKIKNEDNILSYLGCTDDKFF